MTDEDGVREEGHWRERCGNMRRRYARLTFEVFVLLLHLDVLLC